MEMIWADTAKMETTIDYMGKSWEDGSYHIV